MRFHQRASHLPRKIAMLKKSFATLKLGGAKRISQHLSGSVPLEAQVLTVIAASRTPFWLP
jgi:hypothetical protein